MKRGSTQALGVRSLVADANFIQATRDTGYRSTGAAVSELIDNALQAGADHVQVQVSDNSVGGGRRVTVSVLDNGSGMPANLHAALQFGGTDRSEHGQDLAGSAWDCPIHR